VRRRRHEFDLNLRAEPLLREYHAVYDRIVRARPRRVLDWGCGHGHGLYALREAGLDVEGLEYDAHSREGERRVLDFFPEHEATYTPDPVRLPFADGEFDAVLSLGVLEHVPDPDGSLAELHRVLQPEGTLYVYKLPNRWSYLEAIARLAGLSYHGSRPDDTLWTVRSARRALERHGFRVIEARRANMVPLTLTGPLAGHLAGPIWMFNRILSRIPALNLIATNVETLAVRR
jgi:SAM-dependent methyltransferase